MDYMKDKAYKAKDAISTFIGGNTGNPDPDMEVDPPYYDQHGQSGGQYFGQQRQGEMFQSSGGHRQQYPQQYAQGPPGNFGQQGHHGGNYQHRQQAGYSSSSGRRTDAAFHEQSGGAFHSQHAYRQQQEQLREIQLREQRHRSLQASKQMVYDVYSQTIGMLEEFEDFDEPDNNGSIKEQDGHGGKPKSRETVDPHHEMTVEQQDPWGAKAKEAGRRGEKQSKGQQGKEKGKKKRDLGRSDIKMPDQSHKTKRDVKAIVEAELVCLQAQLRFCPAEIREQTRQELVEKTLGWVAAREEKGLKKGLADVYASQVVEILITGETKLEVPTQWEESAGKEAGEEAVLGGVRALQMGQHFGAEQDKQFHDDPKKKAQCPQIRSGPVPEVHGAQRIMEVNPNLQKHFEGSNLR